MAKLNVNYANLNEGFPGEALRALTGMPTSYYGGSRKHNMSNDDLYDLLTDSQKENFPMVAGTGGHTSYNLVPGHAFTILGTQTITNKDGDVVERLVKMRNPWGKFMYTGPWSGHSDYWTDYYKDQVDGYKDDDEGIFFMPLDIWRTEYEAFTICHYRDDWNTHELTGEHSIYESNSQEQEWIKFHNPVV
jgi:calpain-15